MTIVYSIALKGYQSILFKKQKKRKCLCCSCDRQLTVAPDPNVLHCLALPLDNDPSILHCLASSMTGVDWV